MCVSSMAAERENGVRYLGVFPGLVLGVDFFCLAYGFTGLARGVFVAESKVTPLEARAVVSEGIVGRTASLPSLPGKYRRQFPVIFRMA